MCGSQCRWVVIIVHGGVWLVGVRFVKGRMNVNEGGSSEWPGGWRWTDVEGENEVLFVT